jgi:hypothetical protein
MSSLLDLYSPERMARLPKPTQFKGWLTGVGSRETPESICHLMRMFAAVTYSLGYRWRSGGAKGADEAFEQGVLGHPHYQPGTCLDDVTLQVFLPWNGYKPDPNSEERKYQDYAKGYIDATKLSAYPQAQEMVPYYHPLGDRIRDPERRGIFGMHARNMFQPLGPDLLSPSRHVYLYAKPSPDARFVSGGTRTAHFVASQNKLPITNFYFDESRNRIAEFLRGYALKNLVTP